MCLDIVSDKALANVFFIKAILRLATKNRFCESSQRLIQPRLVRCRDPLIAEPPGASGCELRGLFSLQLL